MPLRMGCGFLANDIGFTEGLGLSAYKAVSGTVQLGRPGSG
jgi:hypothetical protein